MTPSNADPDSGFDQRDSGGQAGDRPWLKLAGMGMELAGSTLGLAAVGYFVDRYRGQADGYGIALGAFIGFGFGMFRFIQKAMQQLQDQ